VLTGGGRDLAAFEANTARLAAVRGPPTTDLVTAAVLARDTMAADTLLRRLDRNQPTNNLAWPRHLSMWIGAFDVAERGARSQMRQANTTDVRRAGHRNLARILAGGGGWSDVEEQLDLLAELDPIEGRRQRALLTSLPWFAIPAPALEVCRAELVEWRPDTPAPDTPLDRAYEAHRRTYYLGLVESKMGNFGAARAWADSLEALPDVSGIPAVVEGLAATVRADVAWREGRPPSELLSLLEPVRGEVPALLWTDPMIGQEHARLLRAIALHEAGRDDEALRWLQNGFENTPGWDYYRAPVAYLTGLVMRAEGRKEEAAAARATFERLWAAADAPIALPER